MSVEASFRTVIVAPGSNAYTDWSLYSYDTLLNAFAGENVPLIAVVVAVAVDSVKITRSGPIENWHVPLELCPGAFGSGSCWSSALTVNVSSFVRVFPTAF